MARRTPDGTSKPPSERSKGAAYFYAAEVVRILGLQGIDYAQLRRLLCLARPTGDPPTRGWGRFSFEDLVAIRVAVRLAGGTEALAKSRRLQLAEVERTCARLRELGIVQPLLEVPLRREGRAVLADFHGVTFRPATGQLALAYTSEQVREFLSGVVHIGDGALADVRRAIEGDCAGLERKARKGHRVQKGGFGA
jgi:hypothetical protein